MDKTCEYYSLVEKKENIFFQAVFCEKKTKQKTSKKKKWRINFKKLQ